MFTGIIDHSAKISRLITNEAHLTMWVSSEFDDLQLGESICVDGVCLTVTEIKSREFSVNISPKTTAVTIIRRYQVGDTVNLERAMRITDRLGGHVLTGHVDQALTVKSVRSVGDYQEIIFVGVKPQFQDLLVVKGSVAVNGVSLTINAKTAEGFSAMVIPHTLAVTDLAKLSAGYHVNVEFDYLAKLVTQKIVPAQVPSQEADVMQLYLKSDNQNPVSGLISVSTAIERVRQGRMVVVVDAKDRENEGDLVVAGQFATADNINFMSQFGRGLICMPMAATEFQRLNIPMMVNHNRSPLQTAFGVSIGAAHGIGTGISAKDRAITIRMAANPNSTPADIVMPGHVLPLKARDNGVIERQGHTEASIDLVKLAGLQPVAVICEVMKPDGTMARLPDLIEFAKEHDLGVVTIDDILQYRLQHESVIAPLADAVLPLENFGDFRILTFSNELGASPLAIIKEPLHADRPCLVRVHSECLTGDVFGSMRCDCGHQLQAALAEISQQGGIVIYLRQEGRGIGLSNKIKAYALQDQGLDTVEANQQLGFPVDCRDYAVAAQVLQHFSIKQVRLLTNNPVKVASLQKYGINIVERVPVEVTPTHQNKRYLKTKRDKLGHLLASQELVK